jgi:hypothetical protein
MVALMVLLLLPPPPPPLLREGGEFPLLPPSLELPLLEMDVDVASGSVSILMSSYFKQFRRIDGSFEKKLNEKHENNTDRYACIADFIAQKVAFCFTIP